jgi:hypothetical protein
MRGRIRIRYKSEKSAPDPHKCEKADSGPDQQRKDPKHHIDQYFIDTSGTTRKVPKSLAVFRIRSVSRFNQVSRFVSGSRRAKMTHKKLKKIRKFHSLKCECSLLRAEGFFCSLDLLYGGLGIGKLKFLIQIFFFQL